MVHTTQQSVDSSTQHTIRYNGCTAAAAATAAVVVAAAAAPTVKHNAARNKYIFAHHTEVFGMDYTDFV